MAKDLENLQDQLRRTERAQEAFDTLREIEKLLQDAGRYVWRWNEIPREIKRLLACGGLPEMEAIRLHIQGIQRELEKVEERNGANSKKNGSSNTDI